MNRQKRHKPEEIILLLRECDASHLSQEQFCQQKQISVATLHRWRKKYGMMDVEDAKRLKALEKELSRASQATDSMPMEGQTNLSRDLSLRRVETYWEFKAADAASLLETLAPVLGRYHRHSRKREHGEREHAFDSEEIGNARTLTMFLSKGEQIRVYAKTADRVRFEVAHFPRKLNGLIPGGYEAETRSEFFEKLECLRAKAAERVNHLLAFLSEWAEETPQERAGRAHYTARWFQTLGFGEGAIRLLDKLQSAGRIVGGACLSDQEQKALRRAREAGLVFRHESASAYYPAAISHGLPLSGHNLTGCDSDGSPMGHESKTQAVPCGFVSDSFSEPVGEGSRIPPCPPFFL